MYCYLTSNATVLNERNERKIAKLNYNYHVYEFCILRCSTKHWATGYIINDIKVHYFDYLCKYEYKNRQKQKHVVNIMLIDLV